MPTLLLSRTCEPEASRFSAIASQTHWQSQWLSPGQITGLRDGDELAIYAETGVALAVARKYDRVLVEPTLGLLTKIPPKFVGRQIRYMTLADALQLRTRQFIKPADCANKVFDPTVCEQGREIRFPSHTNLAIPVLVSDPVRFVVEYRVVVCRGRVVTFSPYIRDGWLARDENGNWPFPEKEAGTMLRFCDAFLAEDRIDLPPAFVLDVGMTDDGAWAIVEFNPVWCSGLLGCDLESVFPVLSQTCFHKTRVTSTVENWVIDREHLRAS